MMHHTLINLCDFINQYFQAPSSGAYEVYINDNEYTSIKLVVPDCGYMIYVYDSEGKLLGIKVEINNAISTLLVGKFNVIIPVYENYTTSTYAPYTSYLG